jgi:hypothetical protein
MTRISWNDMKGVEKKYKYNVGINVKNFFLYANTCFNGVYVCVEEIL